MEAAAHATLRFWPQKHSLLQAPGRVSLKSCLGPKVRLAARVRVVLACRAWAVKSDPGRSRSLLCYLLHV